MCHRWKVAVVAAVVELLHSNHHQLLQRVRADGVARVRCEEEAAEEMAEEAVNEREEAAVAAVLQRLVQLTAVVADSLLHPLAVCRAVQGR